MTFDAIADWLPLAALYAETHYRFKYFPFSLYYRRSPEIIFDAPYRLEPGQALPVTLIIKDADRFPILLESTTIEIRPAENAIPSIRRQFNLNESISNPLWHCIFEIDVGSLPRGKVLIHSYANILLRGHRQRIFIDNCIGLSHRPLATFCAADPLPNFLGWSAGELHCHTSYGGDQVEFGAPLPVIKRFAESLGLGWTALTDHSYNLDDNPRNYLKYDPTLTKWRQLWMETERLNNEGGVLLIPGEELSCRNARYRNVHLLIIGNSDFLAGSGDGAEKWFQTKSEFSIEDALKKLEPDAVALAAHPYHRIPILEWLLVRRGKWSALDLSHLCINGWQIINGDWDKGFRQGFKAWLKFLRQGHRTSIYAGNDAHGNFNRFRQVRLPMLKLWEHHNNLFGVYTTRLRLKSLYSPKEVLNTLKSGSSYISNGPALNIQIITGSGPTEIGGETSVTSDSKIVLRWYSTPEFGKIVTLRLKTVIDKKEIDILNGGSVLSSTNAYSGSLIIPGRGASYLRAELISRTDNNSQYYAYTNPIWLKSQN
ncbi:MAG: hypothetical protein FJY65_03725 [Calditrichaeota bacterium]|nr:hypothetical protein [Calditrichota bacterium]